MDKIPKSLKPLEGMSSIDQVSPLTFAVKSIYAFSSNVSRCFIVESIYFIYVE